jgi:hypothetical protein
MNRGLWPATTVLKNRSCGPTPVGGAAGRGATTVPSFGDGSAPSPTGTVTLVPFGRSGLLQRIPMANRSF